MSDGIAAAAPVARTRPGIGFFERWLTLWVALCIVAGIALGRGLPGLVRGVAALR